MMEGRTSEYRMRHSGEGDKQEQIGDKSDTEKKNNNRKKEPTELGGRAIQIAFFTLPVE